MGWKLQKVSETLSCLSTIKLKPNLYLSRNTSGNINAIKDFKGQYY